MQNRQMLPAVGHRCGVPHASGSHCRQQRTRNTPGSGAATCACSRRRSSNGDNAARSSADSRETQPAMTCSRDAPTLAAVLRPRAVIWTAVTRASPAEVSRRANPAASRRSTSRAQPGCESPDATRSTSILSPSAQFASVIKADSSFERSPPECSIASSTSVASASASAPKTFSRCESESTSPVWQTHFHNHLPTGAAWRLDGRRPRRGDDRRRHHLPAHRDPAPEDDNALHLHTTRAASSQGRSLRIPGMTRGGKLPTSVLASSISARRETAAVLISWTGRPR